MRMKVRTLNREGFPESSSRVSPLEKRIEMVFLAKPKHCSGGI